MKDVDMDKISQEAAK